MNPSGLSLAMGKYLDWLASFAKEFTKWEKNKTEVENEIEIFITLTKYNICQRREEGRPLLLSIFSPQRIYEEWDVSINVHRKGI